MNAYVLIDCTNNRALARHASYRALGALAWIQFANVDTAVVPLDAKRHLSFLDGIALANLYADNGHGKTAIWSDRYMDCLQAVHELLCSAPNLDLPFETAELEEQAKCIEVDDSRPYDFVPGAARPKRAKSWCCAPQRDRTRAQHGDSRKFYYNPHRPPEPTPGQAGVSASAPWLSGNEGGTVAARNEPVPANGTQPEESDMAARKSTAAAPAPAAKPAPAKKAATAPAAAPAAKEKKEKAPKPDRVEQNGVVRPKAGGKCDAVWKIADEISRKKKAPAEAGEVMAAGKEQGLNESNIRAEYQRWRKFNGLTGRTPKAAK